MKYNTSEYYFYLMFVNRHLELATLNQCYTRHSAELFVLYGRRRTGKTALLQEFCRHKPHVYYLAAQMREADNLEQFRQTLMTDHPDPLLATLRFTSWDVALAYLTQIAQHERLIVVLDEFPYLCQDNPALPSILQRWWDTSGRTSHIFLILCGSHVGFMENEVLAEKSPLYGRRTGQAKLMPLLPWDAALFFPNYTPRERLATYGILGGIPAYLERWDPASQLPANLLREALTPLGFFYEEVNFLLRTELSQVATYLSILKAIALGATRLSELATRTGVPISAVPKYLNILREMGLVRREVPFTEAHPEKSKRGLYRINDPFVAFWCRFILSHQSLIEAGLGEVVWHEFIIPQLDTHLGPVFEEVCRQFVLHRLHERFGLIPRRVGRYWDGGMEIDVLADVIQHGQRGMLVGECKWWTSPVGGNVLRNLKQKAEKFAGTAMQLHYILFSAAGFTEELHQVASQEGVLLVDSETLLIPTPGQRLPERPE